MTEEGGLDCEESSIFSPASVLLFVKTVESASVRFSSSRTSKASKDAPAVAVMALAVLFSGVSFSGWCRRILSLDELKEVFSEGGEFSLMKEVSAKLYKL